MMRILAAIAAAAVALAISGCGALPPRGMAEPSQALADGGGTALGRLAAASLPPAADAGLSGFRLLPVGEHAFATRTVLAARAELTLDAQYYHIHSDPAGVTFLRELRDAARRGVRVRLLVDDYHASEVYPLLAGLSAHPNVEVRLFNPLPVRRGTPFVRMLKSYPEMGRVNHRMHNKLFVADNAIAIYGGRNIADEYFMRHGEANFVDLDVISAGPVVQQLSQAFDRYWNSEHAWPLRDVLRLSARPQDLEAERADFARRVADSAPVVLTDFPLDPLGHIAAPAEIAAGQLALYPGRASVHADPPSKVTDPVVLYHPTEAMRRKLEVIGAAESEVVIVSPYLIPGELGMQMMADAARTGRRGMIFTNSLGSTDEPAVHRAYSAYRRDMLALGMELYELSPVLTRRSGSFGDFGRSISRLHVKAAMVDRRWLLVGSVNLDARSAILNTELGVVIDCAPLAADAMKLLTADHFASMYRLQLAADGQTIEWISIDDAGQRVATRDEPGDDWLLRLQHGLQSLFVIEEDL